MTPKCEIRWIDSSGRSTEDSEEAVCLAVSTIISGPVGLEDANVRRFPCCAKHAVHLDQLVAKGIDRVTDGDRLCYTSQWSREPLCKP